MHSALLTANANGVKRRVVLGTRIGAFALAVLGAAWGPALAAGTPVPDFSGKVMTVRGLVSPDSLGQTLMHEHIFIDFSLPYGEPARWRVSGRKRPEGAEAIRMYYAPLTMDILSEVQYGAANLDNWRLDSLPTAIKEVADFRLHGGGTIVDESSIGLARNPVELREVSEQTGVNIVMGSSWYTRAFWPADLAQRTVEDMTDEIVHDITVGVGGTGIHSGIVGEVGTSNTPQDPIESKIIRASGRASRLTGAAIMLHSLGFFRKQGVILDMLESEGADPTRIVLGHSDWLASDLPYLRTLLKRHAMVEFDVLGKPATLTKDRPADQVEALAIIQLIHEGYAPQLLLSQDICTKTSWKAYGGTGYAFMLERFVPFLKAHGITDAQIRTILVDNPRRLLTFVAPKPM